MGNAQFSVSLMGSLFACILIPLYLSGHLNWLNYAIQDRFFQFRNLKVPVRSEIVLIAITDETIAKLGWPLPRQHYTTLLKKLQQAGVKAMGFNILLSTTTPQTAKVDQELIAQAGQLPNLVMPYFYDYATERSYLPLPQLMQQVNALGNVSMYPGEVARFIETPILNRKRSPAMSIYPMGVELARLYLGLKPEQLQVQNQELKIGSRHKLALENGLLRVHYQGPPGYFQRIPLEQVLAGTSDSLFKNKLVLLGAFSPTLGDVTTSPYGDQTSQPLYGTEAQAHLAQSILVPNPLYQFPPLAVCLVLLLLSLASGLVFTRYNLLREYILLLCLALLSLILAWIGFIYFQLVLDCGPFLCFFALMAIGQTTLINLRSNIAIKDQISKLQEYEQKLPDVDLQYRLENICKALFYISHAQFVSYRRYDPENRQLVLQNIQIQVRPEDPQDELPAAFSFRELPSAYGAEILPLLARQGIQILPLMQLPPSLLLVYRVLEQGQFLFLPIHTPQGQLYGMFELYFYNPAQSDEVQMAMLEEFRLCALQALHTHSLHQNPSRGLIPGVEEKISAMVRLVAIREMEVAFFSAVLESTSNPVVVCDQIGEIRFYNDNFTHLLQMDAATDITSANIQELMNHIFEISAQQWQDIWLTTLYRRRQKEVQVSTDRGVYHLTLTPVFGEGAQVTGVVMILTDVTKLHRQANYDKLTGLFNRRYFDELILREFQRCQRHPEYPFALLMLDVDYFKRFNDTYGHQVGDQVLASFGQVLSQTVRRTDMAIRYGGEEMAVILPNTSAEQASLVAEKIRRAITRLQLYDLEGRSIRQITASIGVAQFGSEDQEYQEVIRRADEALYRCKESGRNCIYLHLGAQGIVPFSSQRASAQQLEL